MTEWSRLTKIHSIKGCSFCLIGKSIKYIVSGLSWPGFRTRNWKPLMVTSSNKFFGVSKHEVPQWWYSSGTASGRVLTWSWYHWENGPCLNRRVMATWTLLPKKMDWRRKWRILKSICSQEGEHVKHHKFIYMEEESHVVMGWPRPPKILLSMGCSFCSISKKSDTVCSVLAVPAGVRIPDWKPSTVTPSDQFLGVVNHKVPRYVVLCCPHSILLLIKQPNQLPLTCHFD